MRIKDLIEQLSTYEENSEVIIYDDGDWPTDNSTSWPRLLREVNNASQDEHYPSIPCDGEYLAYTALSSDPSCPVFSSGFQIYLASPQNFR